jgi:predicted PurR-regulated permease PerM
MQQSRKFWVRSALFVGTVLIFVSWLINNLSAAGDVVATAFNVLKPFLTGGLIAYLLYGPVASLERALEKNKLMQKSKAGIRRGLAIAFVYLVTLAAVALLFSIVLPEVIRSIGMLVTRVRPAADVVASWLTRMLEKLNVPQLTNQIFASWESIVSTLLSSMGGIAAGAYNVVIAFLSGAFNLGLGLLISVYILLGREKFAEQLKKTLYAGCEIKRADALVSIARRTNQIFSIFLYVRIICSVIVGVVTYLAMLVFGIRYAVLISVISGVFNFIPIFGPIVGTIVCGILLAIVSPAQMLTYLIITLIIQQIEGNIVEPNMMGDRIGLPALWVLFAVLVGDGLFGIMGMIIGVPFVAIAYSLVQAMVESRLKKKEEDQGFKC